jgi:hypothetical protein
VLGRLSGHPGSVFRVGGKEEGEAADMHSGMSFFMRSTHRSGDVNTAGGDAGVGTSVWASKVSISSESEGGSGRHAFQRVHGLFSCVRLVVG